jgi:tetratricopeptide (TPR) repeat protein
LTRALSIDSAFFEALHDRGLLRTELGRAEAALEDFDRALALKPDSFEAFYNRGRALDELQRYQEAVESYDRALALKPVHAQSWTNRGAALVDLTRHEEALESFDRAIALAPTHVEAWSGRGIALNFLRRHTEALAAYARGLQIRPGDSEVRWREFFTRAALGDFEAAWPLFEGRWNRPEIGRLRHRRNSLLARRGTAEGKRILVWSEQASATPCTFAATRIFSRAMRRRLSSRSLALCSRSSHPRFPTAR